MDSVTFARWLGKMHVNMYVSWTDAVPNVVVDSLAAGVPVIVSDTSPWFDGSPELKDLLVEPRSDDPGAIYRRVVRTLAFARDHRPTFTRLVKDMLERSRARAVASWDCFLNGLAAGGGIMCSDGAAHLGVQAPSPRGLSVSVRSAGADQGRRQLGAVGADIDAGPRNRNRAGHRWRRKVIPPSLLMLMSNKQ